VITRMCLTQMPSWHHPPAAAVADGGLPAIAGASGPPSEKARLRPSSRAKEQALLRAGSRSSRSSGSGSGGGALRDEASVASAPAEMDPSAFLLGAGPRGARSGGLLPSLDESSSSSEDDTVPAATDLDTSGVFPGGGLGQAGQSSMYLPPLPSAMGQYAV